MWTGPEIKQRREDRGWTQQQLADAVGASRRAVIGWETGQSVPQGRFIQQLEQVLGAPGPPPAAPTDRGPLLVDADFTQTLNHLIDLHNAALRGQLNQVLRVDDRPLPADFPEHHVVEGPQLDAASSGETDEARSNHE